MQNAEFKMQNSECRIQNAKWCVLPMQDVRLRLRVDEVYNENK